MVSARAAAVLLIGVGVAASTLAARGVGHTASFRDGYWILAADFHVHGFPGDGALAPADVMREARRRNLDVIGISDHNEMLPERFGGLASLSTAGILALPAVEVTTRIAHIVAVGVATPLDWRLPPSAIIDAIHAQGGVAIAAHPSGEDATAFDDAAIERLDGFEAAHSIIDLTRAGRAQLAAFSERASRIKPGIAFMGGSDFHTFQPIGISRTFLLVREMNAAGVFDAIRSGRTIACDDTGRAYGPAEYMQLAEGDCRAHATAKPPHHVLNAVGTCCAWLGLLVLALWGNGTSVAPWRGTGGLHVRRS